MKIACYVTSAEDCGDRLRVTLQDSPESMMRFIGEQVVEVPITERNRRAFHVGRRVTLAVAP